MNRTLLELRYAALAREGAVAARDLSEVLYGAGSVENEVRPDIIWNPGRAVEPDDVIGGSVVPDLLGPSGRALGPLVWMEQDPVTPGLIQTSRTTASRLSQSVGDLRSSNANYATARSASSASGTSTGTSMSVGQEAGWDLYEGLAEFDTRAIPVGATILRATLSTKFLDGTGTAACVLEARLHDFGTSVGMGDWVPGASLSALPLLAELPVASGTLTDFTTRSTWTSYSAFAANIVKGGYTRVMLVTDTLTDGVATERSFVIDGTNVSTQPWLEVDWYIGSQIGVAIGPQVDLQVGDAYAGIPPIGPVRLAVVVGSDPSVTGGVVSLHTVYATAWTSVQSGGYSANPATYIVGQGYSSPNYAIRDVFVAFDTRGIPAGATVTGASLAVQPSAIVGSGVLEARVRDWGGTIESTDFVPGASRAGLTKVAEAPFAALSVAERREMTDVALAANVVKGGITRFVLTTAAVTAGVWGGSDEMVTLNLVTGSSPWPARPLLTVDWSIGAYTGASVLEPMMGDTQQYLRPSSDIAGGGWAVAPLWSKVNESSPDGVVISATAV